MRTSHLLPLLTAILAACSAQKGQDYGGEPLAQVKGSIALGEPTAPSEAKVAIVWTNFVRQGDTSSTVDLSARVEFPVKFTIDILSAPPADQLNDFTRKGKFSNETRVGVGPIYAVAPDVTKISGETPILGVVEDFVVVYVEQNVAAGTMAATFLHGPLSAGFHLMKVVRLTDDQKQAASAKLDACYKTLPDGATEQQQYVACHDLDTFDKLYETEQGFATDVTLKLAPEMSLAIPNYT